MDDRDLKSHIKSTYPRFFYHLCEKCELKYRRTPMWSYINHHGKVSYLCNNCVTDIDEVVAFIKKAAFL